MIKFFFLHIAILTAIPSFTQIKPAPQYPPVEVKGTQLIKFNSAINHRDYEVYISLPSSYKDSINKKYPVLYVLDGQWFFPQTINILGNMGVDGLVPEMIVVGIGWPDNYHVNRNRDFFPPSITDSAAGGGGASKFLSVVRDEIKKFIDFSYRSDKINNALRGASAGGAYALYSLFHDPTLFNKYIISCPTIDYDNGIIFRDEKAFAATHRNLNAKIFMTTSEYEEEKDPSEAYDKLIAQIKASNYAGLQFESIVVEKLGHGSQDAYGMARGLQFVFHRPDIKVDTSLLIQYVGHYEQGQVFVRTGDSLYAIAGTKKALMHAETNDSFYMMGINATAKFVKDNNGKISGFNLITPDGASLFKKID